MTAPHPRTGGSRGSGPRTRLSPRSKARKRAVDILFEAELRAGDPLATLAERTDAADPPVREFTRELVHGVVGYQREIDARIRSVLRPGWTLERMPRVDRCVARIAVYELDWTDMATSVAVSEAVALVQDLSTDDSPAFLNGVLSAIAADRPVPDPASGDVPDPAPGDVPDKPATDDAPAPSTDRSATGT